MAYMANICIHLLNRKLRKYELRSYITQEGGK